VRLGKLSALQGVHVFYTRHCFVSVAVTRTCSSSLKDRQHYSDILINGYFEIKYMYNHILMYVRNKMCWYPTTALEHSSKMTSPEIHPNFYEQVHA